MLVVEYARRARYREGFGSQVLLEPGQPASICFDVGWSSITFNAGHRIRICVSSGGACRTMLLDLSVLDVLLLSLCLAG